jgi:hypothetical protein
MIEKLLEMADGRLLIPLVVAAVGVAMAKGAFSLFRSRSQDRRDFLDLFRDHEAQSDLWMTVAVRHVFGAYLPASLIRQLMSSPQPGRALLEVGGAWDFIDMDDETGELTWRRKLFRAPRRRRVVVWTLNVAYFVLAATSLWLAYLCLTGQLDGRALWIAWVYAILCGAGAFAALAYGDSLNDASKAAERWLGLA